MQATEAAEAAAAPAGSVKSADHGWNHFISPHRLECLNCPFGVLFCSSLCVFREVLLSFSSLPDSFMSTCPCNLGSGRAPSPLSAADFLRERMGTNSQAPLASPRRRPTTDREIEEECCLPNRMILCVCVGARVYSESAGKCPV